MVDDLKVFQKQLSKSWFDLISETAFLLYRSCSTSASASNFSAFFKFMFDLRKEFLDLKKDSIVVQLPDDIISKSFDTLDYHNSLRNGAILHLLGYYIQKYGLPPINELPPVYVDVLNGNFDSILSDVSPLIPVANIDQSTYP